MSEQKQEKPKIEDIASEYLSGSELSKILDFVAWLRANKMTPTFGNKSKAGVRYTTRVLFIKLFHGYWEIWISGKAKTENILMTFLLVNH